MGSISLLLRCLFVCDTDDGDMDSKEEDGEDDGERVS